MWNCHGIGCSDISFSFNGPRIYQRNEKQITNKNKTMKTKKQSTILALLAASLALPAFAQTPPTYKMTTPIPPQITTPDSVETRLGTLKFFDGFPDDPTVEKVMDNLDFSRGVQSFLAGLPGTSLVGMRKGMHELGCDNSTVMIFEQLLDYK
jgi:hypothetical protein